MLFQKKGKYSLPLLVIVCLIFGAISCETKEPECYEPIVVRVNNGFIVTDTIRKTYYLDKDSTIAIDSIIKVFADSLMGSPEMIVLNEDSMIRSAGFSTSIISVPLNASKDSIRYAFRTDTVPTALWDTITFYYTPRVQFISNNCGYTHFFTLHNVKVTNNLFDSVALINPGVTEEANVRNVQFYFKSDF